MTRTKLAAVPVTVILIGLAGLAGPRIAPWQSAGLFSVQDGQLCMRTTCVSRDLRVTTYQTEPNLPSAPPYAWGADRGFAGHGDGR